MNLTIFLFLYSAFYIFMMMNAANFPVRDNKVLLWNKQWNYMLYSHSSSLHALCVSVSRNPVSHPHHVECLQLRGSLDMLNFCVRWVFPTSQLRVFVKKLLGKASQWWLYAVPYCHRSSRTCRARHARSAPSPSELSTAPSEWSVDWRRSAPVVIRFWTRLFLPTE